MAVMRKGQHLLAFTFEEQFCFPCNSRRRNHEVLMVQNLKMALKKANI